MVASCAFFVCSHQECFGPPVSKEEGMEIARKSLYERQSRIADNKQAHFNLGFDKENVLSENVSHFLFLSGYRFENTLSIKNQMAEFVSKKPIDTSVPAAGKANGPTAGYSVIGAR